MKKKKADYEENWLDDSSSPSSALLYRTPLLITEVRIYRSGNGYAICPRCKNPIEFDYQLYCGNCGQCLDWSKFRKAKKVYIGWDGAESSDHKS